jgi:hypothetical protein
LLCAGAPPHLWFGEKLDEKFLRLINAVFENRHGFRLGPGIADQASLVETIKGIPIESLPSTSSASPILKTRKVEQSKHCLVDFICVYVHEIFPPNIRRRRMAHNVQGKTPCRLPPTATIHLSMAAASGMERALFNLAKS